MSISWFQPIFIYLRKVFSSYILYIIYICIHIPIYIERDLDAEIRKTNPKNYDQKYTDTTKQKYYKYWKKLEVKRLMKWENVREKSGSNSKQNASSNAPNAYKDNMLLNVSHNNYSDHCDDLKDSPESFRGTNMVSETNVDSNNIQNIQ